jgi:hypothetical protein
MNKRIKALLSAAWVLAGWFGVMGAVQAYALNLTPTFPDLVNFGSTYTYTSQCLRNNSTTISGTCESGTSPTKFNGAMVSGQLTISGGNMALNPDGSGNIPVSGGGYLLTANFNSSGIFTGGTISATGTTTHPDFQSGTFVSADLTEFGFSGSGSVGSLYFRFDDPFMTGDFAAFYDGYSGIIASTVNLNRTYSNGGWVGPSWDNTDTNLPSSPAFWVKSHFTATGNVDTFVTPVPAAAWLFLSGLLGLIGVSRRRLQVNQFPGFE